MNSVAGRAGRASSVRVGLAGLVVLLAVASSCGGRGAQTRPPSGDIVVTPDARPVPPAAPLDSGAGGPGGVAGPITGWLAVKGPRIVTPDGRPFHGRGANVNDTRSCDSCSWEPPHVDEVLRRIDTLVDVWHASFVRLLLESYADDGGGAAGGAAHGRVHYKNVLEDDAYFRDHVAESCFTRADVRIRRDARQLLPAHVAAAAVALSPGPPDHVRERRDVALDPAEHLVVRPDLRGRGQIGLIGKIGWSICGAFLIVAGLVFPVLATPGRLDARRALWDGHIATGP